MRQLAAVSLAALALLAGGAYAASASGGTVHKTPETVADAFRGYFRGHSADAPGRALGRNESAPDYFDDRVRGRPFARRPRVLAEAGGYKLYSYIAPSGGLDFDLGDTGVGMGYAAPDEIRAGALHVLGPGSMPSVNRHGHLPLFGLAANSVKSVELVYDSGPPLRVDDVDCGFVLLAQPRLAPRKVVGFDADGKVVGRQSVRYIGWEEYIRPPH